LSEALGDSPAHDPDPGGKQRLRVLIAHNYYNSSAPSGENAAVRRDVEILLAAGHDVRELIRSSDEITPRELVASRMGVRARAPVEEFRGLVASGWRPDILHVHNVFPLLTTGPLRFAAAHGVPVVHTLHNFRRTCAAGTHFRRGSICEDCTGRWVGWPAVVHGCYRDSRLQTLPVVVNQLLDREVWAGVSTFIALTSYMRERIVRDLGIDREYVVERPTAVTDPGEPAPAGEGVVYVGRLSKEKGVDLLLRAWRAGGLSRTSTLTLIGDGPDREAVQQEAAATPGVRFLGRLDGVQVAAEMRRAAVVVLPSLWNEGFPTVAAEAFAHGRAVIASDHPNLRAVVRESGWLAPPHQDGFARVLGDVLRGHDELVRRGMQARRRYAREMTPAASYRLLMAAYHAAVKRQTSLCGRSTTNGIRTRGRH
jgi:glycosyltransferase involved in cell wall biosynthesis